MPCFFFSYMPYKIMNIFQSRFRQTEKKGGKCGVFIHPIHSPSSVLASCVDSGDY